MIKKLLLVVILLAFANLFAEDSFTYAFTKDFNSTEKLSFERAFKTWNAVIANRFTFKEVKENEKPTVLIEKGDTGDGNIGLQWGGHIRVTDKYTYHRGEPFGEQASKKTTDLDALALHEVGHFFGLKHLKGINVMYESLHSQSHYLHDGDIAAIRRLYGFKD